MVEATPIAESTRDAPARAKEARAGRRRPRLTLLQLLLLAFGGLMLVGLVLVVMLSAFANNRNTFNLLNDNAVLLMRALHDDVIGTLEPSTTVAATVAAFYADERFDLVPTPARRAIFEGILAGAPHVDALVAYSDDGRTSGIARTPDGTIIGIDRLSRLSPEAAATMKLVGPEDPPAWGPPVFVDGGTYVNVVTPLVRDGEMEGTVVLAMGTDQISRIVSRLVSATDAVAFVLYGEDGVLARSGEDDLYSDGDPRRQGQPVIPIGEVSDPVLAQFSNRFELPGFGDAHEHGVDVASLEVAGTTYLIVSQGLEGFGPKPWTIGIYQPLSDFSEVFRRLAGSILASLGILIVCLVAVFVIARTIARVLGRTSKAAHSIAALEFDTVEPLPPSLIHELDTEAHAFNAMRRGLADFARYVPRQIVERLIRDGEASDAKSRRRAATVMFTDIVGFTAKSERMEAEDVAALLNRHFGLVVERVSAEHGIVDKYLGDGVMAFWMTSSDGSQPHAEPAVRAALAIAEIVEAEAAAAREAGEVPLRLRIGLHSGDVIAGNVGPPDRINFTIVGDTVNVASRLEQLGRDVAPEADCVVLASETTIAGLPADIARGRIGSVHLRNRTRPLEVWRVLSDRAAVLPTGEAVYDMRDTDPPA